MVLFIQIHNILQNIINNQHYCILDASGKQQARNSRRRDFSSNFSQTQKNDRSIHNGNYQNKQQQQQQQQNHQIFAPKSRGNDKQRSTRNANTSDGYSRATTAQSTRLVNQYEEDGTDLIDNDFEIELNSVYLPGSKKQNLNHLLNFNYAPRERADPTMYMRSGNINKGHHTYVKRVKYNKEQFLQAKYVFLYIDR